ncbi:MAG TPA: hypothetical protein PKD61_22390, partial [Polyangiaceae bacterium]|nr:hypothetical protein [Polyangiaceae bacterium]
FLSGEGHMSHSIANLEHHHFKYGLFRQPGDVHVHMFGTATLSFADGIRTGAGDVPGGMLSTAARCPGTFRSTLRGGPGARAAGAGCDAVPTWPGSPGSACGALKGCTRCPAVADAADFESLARCGPAAGSGSAARVERAHAGVVTPAVQATVPNKNADSSWARFNRTQQQVAPGISTRPS